MSISQLPELTSARAHELIDRFATRRITVVGDVMLDRFLIGRVSRMSPEAPVPVVVHDHDEYRLGGAANVANNLRELGAAVDLIGVVGNDDAGMQLKGELAAKGIHSTGLITDHERRTTTKMRVVTTRNQQVSRIDFESDHEIGGAIEDAIASQIDMRARAAQVILVSDYQKGVVTRRSMASLIGFAHANGLPVIVDPKVPHIDYYAGAALVTPNHIEAESATNTRIDSHEDARRAAIALRQRLGVESVLITRGEHGMWLDHAGTDGYLPTSAREVADVTGAGDTVIATLSLALAAGATMPEAARLANEAAGLVVAKFGAATVTPSELKALFREA
ncbi:MAG TPA: D-glycero-beta-D-manno-heptose-7-phosphate kinase [Vicinamibacterales bacterium]|nr:D-glycero-beta-D-manno-heptose-7-phosphate kinase [Vicinamibacterales bacterium]